MPLLTVVCVQVLLSMLKPVMRARLTKVLSETLEQYTRITMEALDGMAYDVHTRAQVFADAGARGRFSREKPRSSRRPHEIARRA